MLNNIIPFPLEPEVINQLLIASITFIAKKGWELSAKVIKVVFNEHKEQLVLEQKVQPTEQQVQFVQHIPDGEIEKVIDYINSKKLDMQLKTDKISEADFKNQLASSQVWKDVHYQVTNITSYGTVNYGTINNTKNEVKDNGRQINTTTYIESQTINGETKKS